MVKTRRSSDLSSPIRMDPFKRRALLNHESREAEGIHGDLSLREAVYKVVKHVFSLSVKGYWFRILPIDDDKDGAEAANELDITHMTHFQWETLLPVLLYIGLIGFRV